MKKLVFLISILAAGNAFGQSYEYDQMQSDIGVQNQYNEDTAYQQQVEMEQQQESMREQMQAQQDEIRQQQQEIDRINNASPADLLSGNY